METRQTSRPLSGLYGETIHETRLTKTKLARSNVVVLLGSVTTPFQIHVQSVRKAVARMASW